jgi:hypothetical protein
VAKPCLVELLCVRCLPGRLGRYLLDQPLQPEIGTAVVGHHQRTEHRDRAAVALDLAEVYLEQVLALGVGRVGREAQLLGQRHHLVLGRPNPLPAKLDDVVRALAN